VPAAGVSVPDTRATDRPQPEPRHGRAQRGPKGDPRRAGDGDARSVTSTLLPTPPRRPAARLVRVPDERRRRGLVRPVPGGRRRRGLVAALLLVPVLGPVTAHPSVAAGPGGVLYELPTGQRLGPGSDGPTVLRAFLAPPAPWAAGHRGVDLAMVEAGTVLAP